MPKDRGFALALRTYPHPTTNVDDRDVISMGSEAAMNMGECRLIGAIVFIDTTTYWISSARGVGIDWHNRHTRQLRFVGNLLAQVVKDQLCRVAHCCC